MRIIISPAKQMKVNTDDLAPSVFESGQLEYVQEHLRILSGFYGIIKPGTV